MSPPTPQGRRTPLLLRFLARAGLRVAVREQIPPLALTLGLGTLLGNDFLLTLATVLFPRGGSVGFHRLALAILFLAAASAAARRVRGGCELLRFLPASGDDWRRATWLAIALALLPLLLVALGLLAISSGLIAVGNPLRGIEPLEPLPALLSALSLVLLALASSAVATTRSARSPRAGSIAWLAWSAVAAGFAVSAGVAIALLVAWDHFGGGPEGRPLRASRRPASPRRARRGPSVAGASALLGLRALGPRALAPSALGLLPLGAGALFVRNNDLPERYLAGGERLAALCALAVAAAALVDTLAARRPPWPWTRSLPWSARLRVALDAALVAALLSPVSAAAFWITPRGAFSAACALSFVALRAATQPYLGSRLSAGTRVLLETLPVAAAGALLAWLPALLLLSAPWWLRLAAAAERDWRASTWRELAHHAGSDPFLPSTS